MNEYLLVGLLLIVVGRFRAAGVVDLEGHGDGAHVLHAGREDLAPAGRGRKDDVRAVLRGTAPLQLLEHANLSSRAFQLDAFVFQLWEFENCCVELSFSNTSMFQQEPSLNLLKSITIIIFSHSLNHFISSILTCHCCIYIFLQRSTKINSRRNLS